jgi:hypothetical protein
VNSRLNLHRIGDWLALLGLAVFAFCLPALFFLA